MDEQRYDGVDIAAAKRVLAQNNRTWTQEEMEEELLNGRTVTPT